MDILHSKTYTRGGVIYIDTTLKDLGRIRFSTKLQASKENLARVLLDIQSYVYKHLRGEPKQEIVKYPIATIAELFLQNTNLKSQTLLKYKYNTNDLVKFFGKKDIRLWTQKDLEAYANNTEQDYKLNFLNQLLRFAKDEGIATHLKPLRVKKSHQIQGESVIPFTSEEVKLLLQNATGELKLFLIIAFFTGARTGEIRALTYEDCDFKNDKILINKAIESATGKITSTKTGTNRYVDMLPILKRTLLSQERTKGTIITQPISDLRGQYFALLEKLNIKKRAIYQTRHTFATMMLEHKEEVLWISAMLGHKSLSTTFTHYVKYIPTQIKRASFVEAEFGGEI
ncbi:site-specific integrase [Helicobacter himalayensis]|uniref:site-specific integrase n=1 Tax=Helicobacter himalayensis TaxID=1591088 RepID=UPI00083208B8|nr:site-specific integrase [Helicobacter himalayensis]